MNREILHRIKRAGEYQFRAVRALLPEEMGVHLDVIEKEVMLMLMEAVSGQRKADDGKERRGTPEDIRRRGQRTEVKKVDIV